MPTPHLNITHILVGQGQKHVTANEAFDALDKATQGATAITIAGTHAVTAEEFRGGFSLELTGTPGAGFDLDVPATRRSFRVSNGTDGEATVQVVGGAGASVVVPVGAARFLYCDGADVTEEGGGSGGGGGGSIAVDDEGTEVLASASRINFEGDGVAATDGGSGEAVVTVPGVASQEGGVEVVAGTTALDFDADDFNVTAGGSGKTTIALADQSLETRVNHTGTDQNLGASRTQVQWNNEIRDEGSWHDPATNNERIVIDTEIVDVHCEITLLNLASADVEARLARYNSADALQEVVTKEITQGASITLQAMNVRGAAAGDYLVVDLLSTDADYDVDGSESYLMVRRASAGGGGGAGDLFGCRVELVDADFPVANLSHVAIEFDSEPGVDPGVWDTDGFHDPGVNPSRLTIPAGTPDAIYEVKAGYAASTEAAVDVFVIYIAKNGESSPGQAYASMSSDSGANHFRGMHISTELVLSAGDYVEMKMIHDSGTLSALASPATFMTLRKIRSL